MGRRLRADLESAFTLCARSLCVICQNLAWVGAGMAVSSLIVVANALRLLPARNKGAD